MIKREAELKAAFRQELKRQLPSFLSLQLATRAAPDRLIVGNHVSSYYEFKHATPLFGSPGDQELMCCRIATLAPCRYVIWWDGVYPLTLIVHPMVVRAQSVKSAAYLRPETWTEGFNHAWLVRYIRRVHNCAVSDV